MPPLICSAPVHADDDPDEWPSGLNLFEELQESRQVVVLGDPGGGKTTLSNWLAWRLTSGSSAPLPPVLENRIPFPCILREMPSECFERGFSVSDLAVAVVSKLIGVPKAEQISSLIRRWVEDGKYVLILDGIDEVSVHRRQLIASWIKEAHRQDAVVLATSRIVGYEDYSVDSENTSSEQAVNEIILNLEKNRHNESVKRSKAAHVHSATHISPSRGKQWAKLRYLMPFNQSQISDFARNWYSQRCVSDIEAKQRASDLLASLAQSDITQKLARTPNLLSLMAIVHRERAHLPDGKALLYDEIVNAYLNTIDSQRRIGEEISLSQFGWKDKKTWLAYIGFKLQESRSWNSSSAGILATEDQVIEWLEEAIQASEISDYKTVAREFLNWVARRSGLLLPRGESRYAFVHLSFQEYFCAHHLAGCIVKPAFVMDKVKSDSSVTKERVAAWGQNPAWLETYIFLFETLSAEHGFDWVETLIEIVFLDMPGTLANLAARLVKNKHVKLPGEIREYLASGCVPAIYNEADFKVIPESEVFRILIETGHAVFIPGDINGVKENYREDSVASKVKIMVAVEGVELTSEFLSRFTNLQALSLIEGSIDLYGLQRSHRLRYLRLRDVDVLGYEEVAYFKNMWSLELRRINAKGIQPLAKLKDLDVLELAEIDVDDISPLKMLKKIHYLELSSVSVSDLSPLESLKKIETMYLSRLPATSIEFVKNLRSLESIQISHMVINDYEPLASCKKLSSIDFGYMETVDLQPLAGLTRMNAVFLGDIPNCDVSSLGAYKKLSVLMFDKMSVKGLSNLSACTSLHSAFLRDLEIDDVDDLGALKSTRALTLSRVTPVASINFLHDFKNLRYLDIRNTEVSDISVLESKAPPFTLRLSKEHGLDISSLMSREGFEVSVEAASNDEDDD
ncbi:NACHT domain-containing protein [Pseudomonas sp. A2]|uniref:NACHT domain-containing protein n=1 Tax=Pseudomonas sp. A2 TaxID=107445 RepID=UPI002C4FE09A|nr:NACHT domain-containing protein [Pseudomonas sp. A2]MEB3436016.1 NACHT domain-containing protein [Pseudomonas sp. A2]